MFRSLIRLLWTAVRNAVADDVMTLAAALAFYTSLSLAPLVVLLLWALSFLSPSAADELIRQVDMLIGPDGAKVVATIIENDRGGVNLGGVSGSIGLVTLLFAASAVFGQLQMSLNLIWGMQVKRGHRVWGWVRKRLLSLAMFGAVAFLSLVSLAASTGVAFLSAQIGRDDPLPWVSLALSFLVFVLLFAVVFQLLPDARIAWRDVWVGAVATALLFNVGKHAIGLYLAHRGLGSSYGAAGSVVALLAWVYFSSIIVLFGAEITQAWARSRGRHIRPEDENWSERAQR